MPQRADVHCWWWRLTAVALILLTGGLRTASASACVGDCNGDGTVDIAELIIGVDIVLGLRPVADCQAFANPANAVGIAQLIQGVNSALNGCGGPDVTLTGSCAVPGSGNHGLKPCDAGTPITAFRCDDRTQCLHQQGLAMVGGTTVGNGGAWSVEIAPADASAALVFQASVANAVVYRALAFGTVAGASRIHRAGDVSFPSVDITPVTEAAVRLLDANGLENYPDAGAEEVVGAVAQATADLSFGDFTPAQAANVALQTASLDPNVMAVLQGARNTPTPTASPEATFTATPTSATPLRLVDNGDGTITDTDLGLIWEKKVALGGGQDPANLHDADNLYTWAGECAVAGTAVLCQPNAAASAACLQVTQGDQGCATCSQGACTVDPNGLGAVTTVWDWVAGLNAAGFAGRDDWRIPTAAELHSIVDYTHAAPATFNAFNRPSCDTSCSDLNASTCSCTIPDGYWSADSDSASPAGAWFTGFLAGTTDNDRKTAAYYARAVRGGQKPPSPRFVDVGDGTITDRQTGLMWEKKVELGAGPDAANLHAADNLYTWAGHCSQVPEMLCQPNAGAAAACALQSARDQAGCATCQGSQGICDVDPFRFGAVTTIWDWIAQLNAQSFAGHADWRVPTATALETIIDYSAATPAIGVAFDGPNCGAACIDLSSATCSCTHSDFYWSATTDASFLNSAWGVSFRDGLVSSGAKYDTEYMRAARRIR